MQLPYDFTLRRHWNLPVSGKGASSWTRRVKGIWGYRGGCDETEPGAGKTRPELPLGFPRAPPLPECRNRQALALLSSRLLSLLS